MGNTVSRRTLSVGQEHETLIALEAVGYNERDAKEFIESPGHELAKIVVTTIRRRGIPLSTDERVARAVMNQTRFWGTNHWTGLPYNASFTKQTLGKVANFPWSEDVLNSRCLLYPDKFVRDTHFAYLSLDVLNKKPVSLDELHKLHSYEHPKIYKDWSDGAEFAKHTCVLRWHLALVGAVPGTKGLSYEAMCEHLPPEYEVPWAVDRAQANLLYFPLNKVYLDKDLWVACRDIFNGRRVIVGSYPANGVNVFSWNDLPYPGVGLAAERKSK